MDFLKGIFGKIDPADIFRNVITHATGALSRPVYLDLFKNKMNAASRIALGDKLILCGGHLKKGECAKAADLAADITDDVKF